MGSVGVYSSYALYRRYGWSSFVPGMGGNRLYGRGALEFLRGPVLFDGVGRPA